MSSLDPTQGDQAAIGEVLFTLASGFRELDASRFESVYLEYADWTNAFGTVLNGRDKIVSYLRDLFADPHFAAVSRSRRRRLQFGLPHRTSRRQDLHRARGTADRRGRRAACAPQPLAQSARQARRPLADPGRHVHGSRATSRRSSRTDVRRTLMQVRRRIDPNCSASVGSGRASGKRAELRLDAVEQLLVGVAE